MRAFIAQKKSVPCADCGHTFPPCVMDFDHREGTDKKFSIAEEMERASMVRMGQEIAKCDVVCSNCHRIRTWILRKGRHLKINQAE